jgi:hypothetical protein
VPWTPFTERPATRAAARALITSPRSSDALLAEQAQVAASTVALIRRRLESLHVIEPVPVRDRQRRPYPQRPPSRTRLAIDCLGNQATPRAVADAAGVSLQAAWAALRKMSPQLSDAAAAVETFTVSKMPRQLLDSAAATDQLSVVATVTCDCGVTFTASHRRQPPRRWCSDACRNAHDRSLGHALRPRAPEPRHPPRIPSYPDPPDWSRARCTTAPQGIRAYWTSDAADERAYAQALCGRCPVQPECAIWSLALPVTDSAVYAGMSQAERLRRKRRAMREIARQALGKP